MGGGDPWEVCGVRGGGGRDAWGKALALCCVPSTRHPCVAGGSRRLTALAH